MKKSDFYKPTEQKGGCYQPNIDTTKNQPDKVRQMSIKSIKNCNITYTDEGYEIEGWISGINIPKFNNSSEELVNNIRNTLVDMIAGGVYGDSPRKTNSLNDVAIEIAKLIQPQQTEGVLTGKDAINFIEKANAAEKSPGSIDFTKEVEITNKILDKSGIYKNGITLAGSEMNDLKKIRNYFGSHDVSSFEHFAYKFLDDLLNRFNS